MVNDEQDTSAISLDAFFRRFPNEESAVFYFENIRWRHQPSCGHCGSTNVASIKNQKPMPYRCRDCRKHFSVRTGTVLAETRLPLQKWLMGIYIMTSARRGFPSALFARELGITQKTAWFLAQRILETWKAESDDDDMSVTGRVRDNYLDARK